MPHEPINERLETLRNRILIEKDHVSSVSSSDFPHHYPGYDDSWNFEKFKNKFRVTVNRLTETEMEFDLIGIDASIANAFRRILIAEVPTMAIEHVYVLNNTSVIQDEVLSHRLGLIPIKADPSEFEFKTPDEPPTDLNTIVFKLSIKCQRNPKADANEEDPAKKYINSNVLSKHLTWEAKGDQETKFKASPIGPVMDDILIAKLRPGQEIDMVLHCEKGLGREHAKWSPVATASYRLLPEIIIKRPITGDLADKFARCFPEGVVEVVMENGVRTAKVVNPRKDTVSREVLRHKEFEGLVKLTRVRDHFIFNIESTGIIPPADLFRQSVQVLMEKCRRVQQAIQELKSKSA
ncbi:uncharacterized protein VTP21DRAFT_6683 [Calcarisporiella thermophila]|uniref:uncharacterized protein n=1 Tax=Calcarisporiella thermophila TaxID=911321 RepID=UPI003742E30D